LQPPPLNAKDQGSSVELDNCPLIKPIRDEGRNQSLAARVNEMVRPGYSIVRPCALAWLIDGARLRGTPDGRKSVFGHDWAEHAVDL